MSWQDAVELGLADGIDGSGPCLGIAIRNEGKKAMDHVPRGDGPLLWAENNYVSGSVRVTMEGDVKVVLFVLDEVRLVEGDGRQLWDVVLKRGAITLKLSNLAGAKGFSGSEVECAARARSWSTSADTCSKEALARETASSDMSRLVAAFAIKSTLSSARR
jgi:hypothetical protein